MDGWLTFAAYQKRYPDSPLTEAEFTCAATDAWFCLQNAVHWRASLAKEPEAQQLLAECQAQLLHLAETAGGSWDGVTGVSNHGYSENYASGADRQAYLRQQQAQIVGRVLSAPATRWMLNAGGVYRPHRR